MLHPGSATKASVTEFPDGHGGRLVVKDLRCQHPWIRRLWSRRVLRREERILLHLDGVEGVPRCLGRVDKDALAIQFLAGEPLGRRLDPQRLSRACLDLDRKIAALHARGVVHLDLRQRKNVLVDPEGQVALLDFESALRLPSHAVGRLLGRLLARVDRSAVIKFKLRYAPHLLSPRELRRARRRDRLSRLWFFNRLGPLFRLLFRRPRRS